MFLIVMVSKVLAFSDNISYIGLLYKYTQTFLLSQILIGFTHNVLILHASTQAEKILTTSWFYHNLLA